MPSKGHSTWVNVQLSNPCATQGTNLRQTYEQFLADDINADGVLDSSHPEATIALAGSTRDNGRFEGLDTLDLFLSGKALRQMPDELAATPAPVPSRAGRARGWSKKSRMCDRVNGILIAYLLEWVRDLAAHQVRRARRATIPSPGPGPGLGHSPGLRAIRCHR
jgi:hypothetical protein